MNKYLNKGVKQSQQSTRKISLSYISWKLHVMPRLNIIKDHSLILFYSWIRIEEHIIENQKNNSFITIILLELTP